MIFEPSAERNSSDLKGKLEQMKPSDVRILAVDDEPVLLEIIAELFRTFQYQIDTAPSGNQAWELLQKSDYHLVLSDIRMADGDGLELVKKIRKNNAVKPSVLLISGFADVIKEEIYHLGAEGMFAKPFDSSSVRSAIQNCVLPAVVRWPFASFPDTGLVILKKGKDIAELAEQKSVIFGRGGFFLSYNQAIPEVGSPVLFNIETSSPEPLVFRGAGTVRWLMNHDGVTPAGLGVEIFSMSEDHSKKYMQLFGHVTPFIPSPRKQA